MVELNGIYRCEICGNVVSIIEDGGVALECCGQEMVLLEEKTSEQEGKEKHVPIVEINGGKVVVKIGSVPHPMEEKHYIELVQLVKGSDIIAEKRLKPGQEPVAEFCIEDTKGLTARELCTVHGLWKN